MDLREKDMLMICYFHQTGHSFNPEDHAVIADTNLKDTFIAFGFLTSNYWKALFYLLLDISTQSLISQLPETIS